VLQTALFTQTSSREPAIDEQINEVLKKNGDTIKVIDIKFSAQASRGSYSALLIYEKNIPEGN